MAECGAWGDQGFDENPTNHTEALEHALLQDLRDAMAGDDAMTLFRAKRIACHLAALTAELYARTRSPQIRQLAIERLRDFRSELDDLLALWERNGLPPRS
ncbi:MAG: hypothetical protein AAGE76_07865 [Pseudomonadota bacterium]